MNPILHRSTLLFSAVALAACANVPWSNSSASGPSGKLIMAGGALYACSSMATSDCQDWEAYRSTALANVSDAQIRVPVDLGVSLSDAAIDSVLSDSVWDSSPEFLAVTEKVLYALRDRLEGPDYLYESWQDFRADFREFAAEDIQVADSEGKLLSGLDVWNNSSDAQFSTLERLELVDETFKYTVTAAKVEAVLAQQDLASLEADLKAALSETLFRSVYDEPQLQADVIDYFSKVNVVDAPINGYKLWSSYLSDDEFDFMLDTLGQSDGRFQITTKSLEDLYEGWQNEWSLDNLSELLAVVQALLDSTDATAITYDVRNDLRAAIRSVYLDDLGNPVSFTYEFGDEAWAALTEVQRMVVLQGLVDALPSDYQRPLEWVALAESADASSVNVFNRMIAEASKDGEQPNVLVMTSSSNNSYDAVDFYVDVFSQAGGNVTWLPIDRAYRDAQMSGRCDLLPAYHSAYASDAHLDLAYPDHAAAHQQTCDDPDSVLKLISAADLLFINGGGQRRSLDALMPVVDGTRVDSPEMELIRKRFNANELVVAGTSAGTAVLGGDRLNADSNTVPMIDGGSAHSVLVSGYDDGIAVFEGGLGLFNFGIADTHFSERARETRLIKLAEQTGVRYGFGVDETTALIVQKHRDDQGEWSEMSVVGKGGVYIVDLADADIKSEAGNPLFVRNVLTHYINESDTVRLNARTGELSLQTLDGYELLDGAGKLSVINDDVLYEDNYRQMMQTMIAEGTERAEGFSYEDNPRFVVEVTAVPESIVKGFEDGRASYFNLRVDVTPIDM